MSTLIDDLPAGAAKGSGPSGVIAGGDAPSAKRLVLDAAQSSSGIARLIAQNGTADEKAALVLLTGNADKLGAADVAILNAALGSALTTDSSWDDAVTACANA